MQESKGSLELLSIEKTFEHATDLVFLIEPKTLKVFFANHKALKNTQLDKKEILEYTFDKFFFQKDHKKLKTLIKTTLNWNYGEEPECLLKNEIGKIIFVSIKSSIVELGPDKMVLMQLSEKNHFLGTIDEPNQDTFPIAKSRFNQLLNYFKNGKDNLKKETVLKSLNWLTKITTEQLFDKLELFALNESTIYEKTISIERLGEKIKIDQRLIEPAYQVFSHIIGNALEHAFDGESSGKLTFKAEVQEDNSLLFEIQDNGNGIPLHSIKELALEKGISTSKELNRLKDFEVQQLIFRPEFSTKTEKEKVSGGKVGLDLIKDFVERNFAGDIKVYSIFGEGTKFVVTIPPNAFLISKSTHFCFPKKDGEQWDLQELEKKLNFELEQVRDGRKIPTDSGVIIDFKDLERAKKSRVPLDQSIVVHDFDNTDLVKKVLVDESISHAISKGIPNFDLILRTCLGKQAGASVWGLESYLWPGTDIFEADMRNYESKGKILPKIREFAKGLKSFSELENVLYKLSDELVMNGMFDAPVDEEGKPKYNHLPRSTKLYLKPEEKVTFRFGADPNWVGVSIVDRFGALDTNIIREYVHRCVTSENQESNTSGGAGLGLYTIFNNCHYLVVNVDPGVATEFICLIKLTRSYGRFQKVSKSFSFYKRPFKS